MLPRSLAIVFRLAAHLAAWIPFAIGAIRSVQQGSPVVADGAAIALRSWDVLTPYGPLVGQATQLRNGAFDRPAVLAAGGPGPPRPAGRGGVGRGAVVHGRGLVAIEAAWSVFGAFGGLAASGIIVGTVAWQPLVAAEPYWILVRRDLLPGHAAAGLAVLSGRRRWWPVLVLTASVAAQAHLMFALASAALVVVALVAALADTVRARAGYWWAVLGLTAGGLLDRSVHPAVHQPPRQPRLAGREPGTRQPAGHAFGLKALGASALPPVVWWSAVGLSG